MQFDSECIDVDFEKHTIRLLQHSTISTTGYDQLIAADGYHSIVRKRLLESTHSTASDVMLPHGYKELTLPANQHHQHQLHANALHIWPRGGFMLIALPNIDGTFTVTLFLPFENTDSSMPCFASLQDAQTVISFFQQYFPDALQLAPNIVDEFFAHPTAKMHTIRTPRWSDSNNAVLIGDAAHAIVPFHGQGMNCAFEDCVALDELMQSHSFAEATTQFSEQRKPNADAIADMALENYIEMRDTVRNPKFILQKELSFELERRFPDQFIPRYSMVMFHHAIPYAVAYERGKIQARILDELTNNAAVLEEVDMELAGKLVQSLLPLFKN